MKIVDHRGNPIDTGRLAQPQTAEAGTGLASLATEYELHPSRGLTPATLHAVMQAAERGDLIRQLDLADDMEERDAHLFAELDKRKGSVAALDYTITEPQGASADEKKMTEALREWVSAIEDIEDLVRGMMDGVLKGFSNHEQVWSMQDGVLLPQITFRPQRWFTVDLATRNQMRLRTPGTADGVPLQPFGWISHIHKTRNGYLARGGLVRVLAWPYLFKNYAVRDLAEFLEIYGLPLRVGKYPSGASDDEKRRLLQAVTQIGHNAAGIIPQSMALEFQNAAQGQDAPFANMISIMDAAESKAILGQTLTASEGKNGTQALGKVHNDVRMDIREADAGQIGATLTRQLLWPLLALNWPGADPRRCPKFELDASETEDLTAYADALPKLVGIGYKIPEKWAHERLGIPQPEDGEPVLSAPAPAPLPAAAPNAAPAPAPKPGAMPQGNGAGALAALVALATQGTKQQPDLLDQAVAEALADWRPLLGPLVGPLLTAMNKAVAAGETLESFAARLPQLVEKMDAQPLANGLAQAGFEARLAGEADLDLGGHELAGLKLAGLNAAKG